MLRKAFTILFASIFTLPILSQGIHAPSYPVESGMVVSAGKHAPFWFYSNQYGKISTKNNSIYLLPSIYRNFKDSSAIDYSYNFSPLIRYDGRGRSYMHQWYAELKFHFMHFTAGAKEESFGNQDSSLSSGCIIWSHNARPMPKLTFYVPHYTPVPFTWKYLEFKGGLSHGWLGDNEYNKNVWLHHKYFYLRLGGKLPVHVSYGLHHFAQWGGTYNGQSLPHNLGAFKNVFLGRSGSSVDPTTPSSELLNVLGNHLGSRNFGLEVELKKHIISLYWQNIFEDGSGKAYRNIKDGLFGMSIHSKEKNKFFSGFVYEFLNTTDQSGRYNLKPGDNSGYEYGGNDNYFNNGIYIEGWSFQNMTLGNPLVTSPTIMHGDNHDYIRNNRVMAHHFGMEGIAYSIKYKILYTYSLNYGTNDYPISPEQTQHSIYLNAEITDKLPWNIILTGSIGADFGKLYGDNFGVMFSLKKLIGL
jgi:hypothetical protein